MIDTTFIGALAAAAVALVIVLLLLRGRFAGTAARPEDDLASAPTPSDEAPGQSSVDQTDVARSDELLPGETGAQESQLEPSVQSAGAASGPKPDAAPAVASETETTEQAGPQAADPSLGAFKKALQSTRGDFIARLAKLFKGKFSVDSAMLEEIEEILITADIGVRTTERVLAAIRMQMEANQIEDDDAVWKLLRAEALDILGVEADPIRLEHRPSLILVTGVNGVGKTTTIGKLASKYAAEGRRVLLAAGDTYRAAAVLQLEVWGQRVGCPVIKGREGADPGSVIFDAITRAREERYDLVIADTAGRLHTKQPLMEELKKVERTITRALGGRTPDEILLVLDATTGQNAVQQAHMFREALGITGIVLTKLDGTAKGGVILGIVDEHKVPVRFVGLGERVEDLREFDAKSFVAALFERPSGETLAA